MSRSLQSYYVLHLRRIQEFGSQVHFHPQLLHLVFRLGLNARAWLEDTPLLCFWRLSTAHMTLLCLLCNLIQFFCGVQSWAGHKIYQLSLNLKLCCSASICKTLIMQDAKDLYPSQIDSIHIFCKGVSAYGFVLPYEQGYIVFLTLFTLSTEWWVHIYSVSLRLSCILLERLRSWPCIESCNFSGERSLSCKISAILPDIWHYVLPEHGG